MKSGRDRFSFYRQSGQAPHMFSVDGVCVMFNMFTSRAAEELFARIDRDPARLVELSDAEMATLRANNLQGGELFATQLFVAADRDREAVQRALDGAFALDLDKLTKRAGRGLDRLVAKKPATLAQLAALLVIHRCEMETLKGEIERREAERAGGLN